MDVHRYPSHYHLSSTKDWMAMFKFMGLFASEWEQLSNKENCVAALVEISIQQVINLWETRNKEVYGLNETEQK